MDALKLKANIESLGGEVLHVYQTHINTTLAYFNSSVTENAESKTIVKFKSNSAQATKIYRDTIDKIIDVKTLQISSALNENKIVSELLAQSKKSLQAIIFNRMLEDIKSVSNDLHKFLIVSKSIQSTGREKISAAVAAKKSIKFTHVDKIGRNRNASLYIRNLTQQWLVKGIYDAYVAKAISENSFVTLSNGLIFHPLESDSKDFTKYIHPNTSVFPV